MLRCLLHHHHHPPTPTLSYSALRTKNLVVYFHRSSRSPNKTSTYSSSSSSSSSSLSSSSSSFISINRIQTPTVLNGKHLSESIISSLKTSYHSTLARHPTFRTPTLCAVTVDPQPATLTYLKRKQEAAQKLGFHYREVRFNDAISFALLVEGIERLSIDESIHGIIVQLPLPRHLDVWSVLQAVPPQKDVDGLNMQNQGSIQVGLPCLMPCTPQGVMELLYHYGLLEVKGLHAVVLGRSPLVGKPMANMLVGREGNCTVTILHRNTPDLSVYTKKADIIISAAGTPGLVTPDMVKEGVIIVDVGINFVPSATTKTGQKIVGDVDPLVYPKTRAYTPVPGGVGPMTVAMLMRNLLLAAQKQQHVELLEEGWRSNARICKHEKQKD